MTNISDRAKFRIAAAIIAGWFLNALGDVGPEQYALAFIAALFTLVGGSIATAHTLPYEDE